MTPSTPDLIAHLVELLEKATPEIRLAKLQAKFAHWGQSDIIAPLVGEQDDYDNHLSVNGELVRRITDYMRPADAAFIVALVNAFPALAARLAEVEADDKQASHDALHDLVMLRAEESAIGGGPGFKERQAKAWRAAEEIFEP